MFCLECGGEIPDAAKFCPVCGTDLSGISCSDTGGNGESSDTGKKRGTYVRVGDGDDGDLAIKQRRKEQRNDSLLYSGVGLLLVGVLQFVFRNPALSAGFPLREGRADVFGIPGIVYDVLPYAMLCVYALVILAGIPGICLSGRRRATKLGKFSGVAAVIFIAALLFMRIAHGYVAYRSSGLYSEMGRQNQFARSLYPVFVFTAISSVLSACYIFGAARFGRRRLFHAGKAMIITGLVCFAVCVGGIIFGRLLDDGVPLVAAWAAVAFGTMPVAGVAGLSRRRGRVARFVWGLSQYVVFVLCMLQSIFYAYSTIVLGIRTVRWTLLLYWPFAMVLLLCGVFAFSTTLSAYYMTGLATGRGKKRLSASKVDAIYKG